MNLTTRRRDEVRIYSLSDCEELLRNAMSGDRTRHRLARLDCSADCGRRTNFRTCSGRTFTSPRADPNPIGDHRELSLEQRPGWFIWTFPVGPVIS